VGPDAHADPRRDEDRRPRHARQPLLRRARVQGVRPGARRHGGSRLGDRSSSFCTSGRSSRGSRAPRKHGSAR
jgi:hypothetical protein